MVSLVVVVEFLSDLLSCSSFQFPVLLFLRTSHDDVVRGGTTRCCLIFCILLSTSYGTTPPPYQVEGIVQAD